MCGPAAEKRHLTQERSSSHNCGNMPVQVDLDPQRIAGGRTMRLMRSRAMSAHLNISSRSARQRE